jgi:hypothetical protein
MLTVLLLERTSPIRVVNYFHLHIRIKPLNKPLAISLFYIPKKLEALVFAYLLIV